MTTTAAYQCTCCIYWNPISFLRGTMILKQPYLTTWTILYRQLHYRYRRFAWKLTLVKSCFVTRRRTKTGSHSPAKPDIMTCRGFAGLWLPGLARHLSVLYGRLPVWQRLPCELVATFWLLVQAPLWWSILNMFQLYNENLIFTRYVT